MNRPTLLLGELNDIRSNDEKWGGPRRSENSFLQFRSFLTALGLHELKLYGGKYTWFGKRYAHDVKTRIDRVLANADWQEMFPSAFVKALHWLSSDHRPLLIYTEPQQWYGNKLFCYDNRWHLQPQFEEFLEYNWQVDCAHLPPKSFMKQLEDAGTSYQNGNSAITVIPRNEFQN